MDMKHIILVIHLLSCSLIINGNLNGKSDCPNVKNPLGSVRKRRHLAFPKGSSVGIVTSVVKTFMTHAPSGWFTTVELELTYKLPDAEIIAKSKRRKLHHQQKRGIWETLHGALESRNMDGRACILRAVCEANRELAPKGKSLVHDILRALFTAHLHEEDFVKEMDLTYGDMLEPKLCDRATECPFSIVGMILDINKQR